MVTKRSKKERILERLDEGNLSIDQIAAEMGCSYRYVYTVRYDEKRDQKIKATIEAYGK